ncbi:MAG: amidase [Gammaproteobacteria bacterium]|nr:amidase [Gammaproteobacteria bacterium]
MDRFAPSSSNLQSATDARALIEKGLLTSCELVEACLKRIEQLEPTIGAWAHLDRDVALQQARAADEFRKSGLPIGALHGLPIGIKDIIDTADYPTERGTVLHQGRQPDRDATLVSLLKEAGAIILGKTVSTEMAVYAPGKTRNPHNPEHTPGGSSSGSAAAVAAAMVSLSVGTQTNGSVIRPAAYCGVYGYKPSFGRISRHGVLEQSPPLDTVGVFARDLADLALIADVLMRYDAQDSAMIPIAPSCIAGIMAQEVPANPHFAFIRSPVWEQVEPVTKDALRELIEATNEAQPGTIDIVNMPASFAALHEDHRKVMESDLARSFAAEYQRGKAQLSDVLRDMIERGQQVSDTDYQQALAHMQDYNDFLGEVFEDYDAILTPATPGPAPAGIDATGSPVMNTIWTFCGTPAINLPILQSPDGLPMGVQLVGERNDDARLFRSTRWLLDVLQNDSLDASDN